MANQQNEWFCARQNLPGARSMDDAYGGTGYGHTQPCSTGVEESGGISTAIQSLSFDSVQTDNLPSVNFIAAPPLRFVRNGCDNTNVLRHHQSNSGFSNVGNTPPNGNIQQFDSVRAEIQQQEASAMLGLDIVGDTVGDRMLPMQTANGPVRDPPPTRQMSSAPRMEEYIAAPPRQMSSESRMEEYVGLPHQNPQRVAVPPNLQHMPLQMSPELHWQQLRTRATNRSGIGNDATKRGANGMLPRDIGSAHVHVPTTQVSSGPMVTDDLDVLQHNGQAVTASSHVQQTPEMLRNQLIRENGIRAETIKQMVDTHGIQCLQSRAIFFDFLDTGGDRTNETQDKSMSKAASSMPTSATNFSNTFATAQTNIDSTSYSSAEVCPPMTGFNQFVSSNELPPQHQYNEEAPMRYPAYADLRTRLKSFDTWPKQSPSPDRLANAGYIYTGKSDMCRCFYCGHPWSLWNDTDDPLQEHMKNQHRCFFIKWLCNPALRGPTCDVNMAIGGQPGDRRMTNAEQPILGAQMPNTGQPVGTQIANDGHPVGGQMDNGGHPISRQMANGGHPVGMRMSTPEQTVSGIHVANGGQLVGTQIGGWQIANVGNGHKSGTTGLQGLRRFEPLVCKLCHKYEICVVQLPCGHIICADCVRYDDNGYLDCRICGKPVDDVTAYDNSQLMKKA